METVLVQINNSKAYRLLEDLEDLHIIKVLKKSIQTPQKLSEKYAGKLPVDLGNKLLISGMDFMNTIIDAVPNVSVVTKIEVLGFNAPEHNTTNCLLISSMMQQSLI